MDIKNSIQKSIINDIHDKKVKNIYDFISNLKNINILETREVPGRGDQITITYNTPKDFFDILFKLEQY